MAAKTVSFHTNCELSESRIEHLSKWLSCNGEVWGVGPTAVFASAAALFLYHELEATIFVAGDHPQVGVMEKTMISSMVLGMLALMIHLWVCSMRFFQYYLDTLIRDSPNMLLEMTTAGLFGSKAEMIPLGPLTRFLRQQQPQIHITVCWFLSLCYADYVRKHYCQRFNMPYLEQWQTELHERASRGVNSTMAKVNSFVGAVHQRLRGYAQQPRSNTPQTNPGQTGRSPPEQAPARPAPPAPPPAPAAASPPEPSPAAARPPVSPHISPSDTSVAVSMVSFGQTPSRVYSDAARPISHQDLRIRVVTQASETTIDEIEKLRSYLMDESQEAYRPQRGGEGGGGGGRGGSGGHTAQ